MPLSLNDIVYGLIAPAICAAFAMLLLGRIPGGVLRRMAAPVSLIGGFLLGYWLLGLEPAGPKVDWEWIPYVVLATMAIGPIAQASGVSWLERALLYTVAAMVAAQILVPTWVPTDDQQPSRWTYLLVWTGFVVGGSLLLEPLAGRISDATLGGVLAATLLACAVLIWLADTMLFAQMALAGAAAAAGVAAAVAVDVRSREMGSAAFPFLILLAALLLTGQVQSFSEVPKLSYLLLPLAPLGLWATAFGPLARVSGWKGLAVRWALPLAICATVVAWAVLATRPWEAADQW